MDEFKDQIKDLYKAFSDTEEYKELKFDSQEILEELGVNDTGIP